MNIKQLKELLYVRINKVRYLHDGLRKGARVRTFKKNTVCK